MFAPVRTGRYGPLAKLWPPEPGMYYYKARIYSPMLGGSFRPIRSATATRWISMPMSATIPSMDETRAETAPDRILEAVTGNAPAASENSVSQAADRTSTAAGAGGISAAGAQFGSRKTTVGSNINISYAPNGFAAISMYKLE